MDSYDLYKPLRNQLRRTPLLKGLAVTWAYLQNFQFNRPFPSNIEVHSSIRFAPSAATRGVFEWELDILSKEIILNSPDRGDADLCQWTHFAAAVNKLKDFENNLSERYGELVRPNILIELYRICHRQFPWQVRPNKISLTRYYKIFSHPQLNEVLQRETGLSARTLFTLGLMFVGHYLDNFAIEFPIKLPELGITQESLDHFLSRFACELKDMREAIRSSQSYDQDFVYTFNPLRAHPLIWVNSGNKRTLVAPVPTYLFRRFTEGVYYELCNTKGFSGPFGTAFQNYVGEVLHAANSSGRFEILPERRYRIGKNDKASVDWIVSDATGHIFLECKTKKLTIRAKMALASMEALDEELGKMAGFIVQAYKALVDAKAGHYPHWQVDGRPIYPVIVTLEDWYAFGDRIMPEIDRRVSEGLISAGIDDAICRENPYTIASVAEFEEAIQIIDRVGISNALRERFVGERRLWLFSSALRDAFRTEFKNIQRNLFSKESAEIGMPQVEA